MASAPASTKASAPSGVATLPPTISISGKCSLTSLMVSKTFFECPWALSITKTSTPTSCNALARSRVSGPVPSAAPTINLPEESFVASGCSADFSISFIVTRPLKVSFSSITSIFSILFSYIIFFTESWDVPSLTVTNLSKGVIIEETGSCILSAYLKSLLVTIPFSCPLSTTGIPDILSSVVSCCNSLIDLLDSIVMGSLTTPLSYFLTALT